MNPFNNIISPEIKQLYNYAIEEILSDTGLTIPCVLYYDKPSVHSFCNNCVIDPISQVSSNLYNSTGPSPFPENTICPVCGGSGLISGESSETLNLAVLFDHKYFIKFVDATYLNYPNNSIQTICSSSLVKKIRACSKLSLSGTAGQFSYTEYRRESDPQPIGFGDSSYIVTLWRIS